MRKLKFVMLAIVFLAMSGAAPLANAGEESQAIIFNTADTLEKYSADDIDWPDWIDEKIQAINNGHGEFFAEVSNDSTGWQSSENLARQDTTGVVSEDLLDQSFDGGLNVERFKNLIRLLKEKGLERLAIRYIPTDDDKVFIKLYYDGPSDNSVAAAAQVDGDSGDFIGPRIDVAAVSDQDPGDEFEVSGDKDSDDSNDRESTSDKKSDDQSEDGGDAMSSAEADSTGGNITYCVGSNWSLRLGGEYTAVSDGRPVTTITVDLEADHGKWMTNFTGGYLPQGDENWRFGAFSLAYLPGHNKLGPVMRIIYASRHDTHKGGYLQEGYGPTAGLIFRDSNLTVYLTGGFQHFDRQRQNRRGEMVINLGVKPHVLSF